ncbi:PLP-dependent aminotransferase family protein [Pseudonocardia sp. CA-107938]|uniref:aminotransferase-like domain-containing protein n=1 Tax=Pseudonocardia sp. CA-107938 TaxID=3240021 RepID=UPI003D8E4C1C
MDQAWWTEVVFRGWRERPGPRHRRLASAVLDAVADGTLGEGTRVPAERALAAALGVSRGTVVACYERLATAGVLARRQGAGTFVLGRPSWTAGGAATLLLRRNEQAIDLSLSVPADRSHLPPIDAAAAWAGLDGAGLDPAGLPALRAAVARHLTRHQQLPTEPDQILVTAGAQEALWLLARTGSGLVTTCPTYPGLAGVGRPAGLLLTGPDGADPAAVARLARPGTVVHLMPTGHNPTGTVMPALARQSVAAVADAGRATIVEDLTLADLHLDGEPPPPLAALSPAVVAVGSASKLLWSGLRVGWIRADGPVLATLLAAKASLTLATAAVTQAVTAQLLDSIDGPWLAAHRAALALRRDHLAAELAARLPGWRITRPAAGLSLWVELPVASADAFAHTAARHGVTISPGSASCLDGRHHGHVRLSFAGQLDTLTTAAERLAAAWAAHATDLAASP